MTKIARIAISLAVWVVLPLCLLATQIRNAQADKADPLTVFAAASLKTALDEAASAFTQSTGIRASISYASSASLAKQIEQSAPADIFISADLDWMDYLAGKDLIDPATRSDLLGNKLVLIAPSASKAAFEIKTGFPLAAAIGTGKLATGDVQSVPAGKYAKAALQALGVWEEVVSKIAPMENVRAALALVAHGEAAFGIVYQTDANAEPRVKVIGTFPPGTHPPIVYPIAVTKSAPSAQAARALVQFLKTSGAAIFTKHGFTVRP